jgi:hypothetical protein
MPRLCPAQGTPDAGIIGTRYGLPVTGRKNCVSRGDRA